LSGLSAKRFQGCKLNDFQIHKIDTPPDTITFWNPTTHHLREQIAILDKEGIRFFPGETETKEEIAKRFVDCLWNSFGSNLRLDSLAIYVCIADQPVLTIYEKDLVLVNEPSKPSDYWIFQAVKKLWKNR
jgi:hypothetical protein